jgi:hypothetical protein
MHNKNNIGDTGSSVPDRGNKEHDSLQSSTVNEGNGHMPVHVVYTKE